MDGVCVTEWERERFNEYVQVGDSIVTHLLVLSLSGSLFSLSVSPSRHLSDVIVHFRGRLTLKEPRPSV